jgi:hypothetical protein
MAKDKGKTWSPFLLAIFFNDLEDFLENHNVTGLLKAFSKSINAQYIFFFFLFKSSKNEYNVNKLSTVQ